MASSSANDKAPFSHVFHSSSERGSLEINQMDIDENPGTSDENQPTTEFQTELVPKKGLHSVVWKYFGFKQDDEGQSDVICKACFALVAALQSNTTNLYQHLKCHHKLQFDETVRGKRPERHFN